MDAQANGGSPKITATETDGSKNAGLLKTITRDEQ